MEDFESDDDTFYPDATNPLFDAIDRHAPLPEIQEIVIFLPNLVRARMSHANRYALHHALRRGSEPDVLEYLLNEWCDAVEEADASGLAPIMIAVSSDTCSSMVERLAQLGPRALKRTDHNGRLPLHVALHLRAEASVVECLVRQHFGALKTPDSTGGLPLHVALQAGVDLETVLFLIIEYRQALLARDNEGRLPLHVALTSMADVEVVQLLVEENTELLHERRCRDELHALELQDALGDLPIHTALRARSRPEVVCYLARQRPETLQEAGGGGLLPLFFELCGLARLEVVQCLVESWRESLQMTNSLGELPLHVAIRVGNGIDMVRYLVEQERNALTATDKLGRLPLGLALRGREPIVEVVNYLATEGKDVLGVVNREGALPLHEALAYSAHTSIIQCMIQLYPAALQRTDGEGNLPLHIALRRCDDDEVVKFIIRAWTDAVNVPDGTGVLPLLYTLRRNRTELLRYMVVLQPHWLEHPDSRGRLLVHHAAAAENLPALEVLAQARAETLQRQDNDGCTPLHLALAVSASPAFVRYLARQSVPSLEIHDHQSRLPVHVVAGSAPLRFPTLQALVEHTGRPELLLRRDRDGCTPLHLAARRYFETPRTCDGMNFVRYLIRRNPTSARERNNRGQLALHVAVSNPRVGVDSIPLLRSLLVAWPQSIREADRTGLFPALSSASHSDTDLNVLYFLLRSWPDCVSRR